MDRNYAVIVFDVDGTLIGGESIDWASFEASFEEFAGFALTDAFFSSIEEVTAQAIVHQALPNLPVEKRKAIECDVRRGCFQRLKAAHDNDPFCFPVVNGAIDLLREMKERDMTVAIATGDWRETISFKLSASGIAFEDLPMVTSSEFYGRAEIIRAAVHKAGRSIKETIYVGDALWDLRACKKLGIPFIGVGQRRQKLSDAGALHVLPDLNPPAFWQTLEAIGSSNGFS